MDPVDRFFIPGIKERRGRTKEGRLIHFPYAGISRIRFQGLKLSTSLSFD